MAPRRIRLALLGAGGLGAALAFRARRRRTLEVRALVGRLVRESAAPRSPDQPVALPPAVAVWLSRATERLESLPRAVRLCQSGEMATSPSAPWRRFRAEHWMSADPPGFVWDARFPGPGGLFDLVRVRDSYLGGRGALRADLLGMVGVLDVGSLPGERPPTSVEEERLNHGELLRWLAELPFFPVAALPGGAVTWEETDENAARATVVDGPTRLAADFTFGADEFPERVDVAARWRQADGAWAELPWRGRFSGVVERKGLLLPREAEASWIVEGEEVPYWRGRIGRVRPVP